MACKSCQAEEGDLVRLGDIRANPFVKYNDVYKIIIPVINNNWLSKVYVRLCLYDGTTVFASSKSVVVQSRETLDIVFSGQMPNRNLELKASIVQEVAGFIEICKDAKYISIQLTKDSTIAPPPTPPTVTPSTSPTGGYEEPGYEKPEIGGWFDDLFQNDDIGVGLLDGVGEDIKDIADTTTKNILFIGGILILLVIIIAMLKFR